MQLYFLPLACSMATRIALDEAGIEATFSEVDSLTNKTREGEDFLAVNPMGLVPTLRTDDGTVLTENVAVLQYVSQIAGPPLAPVGDLADLKLQRWLGFIATELHTGVFGVLLGRGANAGAKAYALERARSRLDYLNAQLEGREQLLDAFSVADAYLLVVLNWAQATELSLSDFPEVERYLKRGLERPSVKRSIAIELPKYRAEQRRLREASATTTGAAP